MTTIYDDNIVELINLLNTNTMVLDGFNRAIVGYVFDNNETRIAYSVNHILDILMERDNMSYIEAQEFYYSNIMSLKVDDMAMPIFVNCNNKGLC